MAFGSFGPTAFDNTAFGNLMPYLLRSLMQRQNTPQIPQANSPMNGAPAPGTVGGGQPVAPAGSQMSPGLLNNLFGMQSGVGLLNRLFPGLGQQPTMAGGIGAPGAPQPQQVPQIPAFDPNASLGG